MSACCCIDVDNACDFISHTFRTARKPHVCDECGCEISVGEAYEHTSSLFDGRWSSHRMCWFCVKIREDFFTCGWYFGQLREDFYECQGWDYVTGPQDDDPAADWEEVEDD